VAFLIERKTRIETKGSKALMQGLKSAAALLIRSCCNNNKSKLSHSFLTHCPQHSRSLSSSPPTEDDLDNQVSLSLFSFFCLKRPTLYWIVCVFFLVKFKTRVPFGVGTR